MRENWNCPDLEAPRMEGVYLPVPGSDFDFPECPAASLRDKITVERMTARLGRPAYGDHLGEDGSHPAVLISQVAAELKSGARMAESLSPRVLELAHLWLSEEASRENHRARERERRAKERGRRR